MGAERAFAQVRTDLNALQRSVSFLLGAAMPDNGAFEELDYEAFVQLIREINALTSELEQKLMAVARSSSTEEPVAVAEVPIAGQRNLSDSVEPQVNLSCKSAAQTACVPNSASNSESLDPVNSGIHPQAASGTQIDLSHPRAVEKGAEMTTAKEAVTAAAAAVPHPPATPSSSSPRPSCLPARRKAGAGASKSRSAASRR